jgi:hypothetical protein
MSSTTVGMMLTVHESGVSCLLRVYGPVPIPCQWGGTGPLTIIPPEPSDRVPAAH